MVKEGIVLDLWVAGFTRTVEVHDQQLRQLGLDRDMTTEALLIEAINDLFKKYAKRPIA